MAEEFICLGAALGSILLVAFPIILTGTVLLTLKWLLSKADRGN